jgi:protein gp37
MADGTGISWTDATWNPTTGCDRVSPGCDNCYALTLAARLQRMGNPKYWRNGDASTSGPGFGLTAHLDALDIPLRWRKPKRVFVNSMSDLLHASVPETFIGSVWDVMAQTPRHTYQVLTKRHARLRSLLRKWEAAGWTWRRDDMLWCGPLPGPLHNVWCGVSAEDQHWADIRIPSLLDTPAAVRFVSAEPLLGPIDLTYLAGINGLDRDWVGGPGGGTGAPHPLLDWVIVGGESGPGHRPMDIAWLESIVGQCKDAEVPVWVKQDSGPRSGQQGRIPDDLFIQEFPAKSLAGAA